MRFWLWLIPRLLVACAVVICAYSALTPGSGEKEFRRSLEALKNVNSIHYSMVSDVPAQQVEQEADLVCSDDSYHRRSHTVVHKPNLDMTLDDEIIRTGGHDYELQPSGLWKRGYSHVEPAFETCKRLKQGTSSWVVPDIGELLDHTIIEKGDKKKVNGEVCREWRITKRFLPYGGTFEHRTLCLGIEDHLPREAFNDIGNARWTYAYNTPTKIEAPTALVPEPVHDTYRPPPPDLTLSDDPNVN